MLKRNLLLGGLIAGAFLLPSLAAAGVVDGPCVNCHTMHDSQGGADQGTPGQVANLLKNAGCNGCHAHGASNGATGVATSGVLAPQVIDSTNPLSGGYFAVADADNTHHNVLDLSDNVDVPLGNNPPGGVALATQLACATCHNGSGGHHGTNPGFRLLSGVTGTPAANYGVDLASTDKVGERQNAQYNATAMNLFCANCHGTFHGAANQNGAAGTFVRHPTDISVANGATAPSIVAMNWGTDSSQVPVGSLNGAGVTNDYIMCISCHVPHGGSRADLLAFNYDATDNIAGNGAASTGCESCHSYAGGGM